MPTVLRIGSYRFFFFSNEWGEPPHIHIQEGKKLAKFWLNPIVIASSSNFRAHELNELEKLVTLNKELFEKEWNEYFNR
ncbi:MAG: DUF4160 domain-containing protein [Sulfuricurvum sp.]|nr:DUF4160 domain-containing protein [Sulfuricurvum sp.]MDD5386097.1 DUF4160 domain-containing protein [Sulfuricurvum sp.]